MEQGNVLGYAVLILFVPFAMAVYAVSRALMATLVVMLVGLLLLPERIGFDPPGLPAIDKYALVSVCVGAGLIVFGQGRALLRSFRGFPLFLVALAMAGMVGTWYTNRDPLQYGRLSIPGLTPREIISSQAFFILQVAFPFFVGRSLCRHPEEGAVVFKALVIATVLYSLPILLEVRLSPQLHRWVYGFHQHQFAQTLRFGGFRPTVFMRHGIPVALLIMAGLLSAITLRNLGATVRGYPAGPLALYLSGILVACKSTAALCYGVAAGLLLLVVRPAWHIRIAFLLAIVSLIYPLLRFSDRFPVRELVDAAARWDQSRAASLDFRFRNEDRLLEKAVERPVYGWGREFGRSRVYSEWGKDISVTDGQWIITLGTHGVVGFASYFGLFFWPLAMTWRHKRHLDRYTMKLLAGFSLIVAIHLIDLLPNSLYYHFSVFLCGAMLGLIEGYKKHPTSRPFNDPRPSFRGET